MPSFSPLSRRLVVSLVIVCSIVAAVLFGATTRAEFDPSAFFAPTLTATKSDTSLSGDGDGKADPGETIGYTVQLNNTGATSPADDATNVTFTDTIDLNTTLVGGSLAASAVAVDDTFPTTVLGNVAISSGAFTVFSNDYLGTNPAATITSFTALSTQGGNVTMNLSTGTFTYDPPAGFEGTDTFTYVLTDNPNASSVVANRTATVTLTVSGMIWFINNNAPACTVAGCGRFSNPFSTLAAFQALNNGAGNNPAANDNIFVYESATAYLGGVTLLTGQKLIGQDSSSTLAAISGLTLPSGSAPFPTMNVGAPTTLIENAAGNGITLATGNNLNGFTAGNASATAIAGVGAPGGPIGTLNVGSVIVNTNGRALNLSSGTAGTVSFTSITSTGGVNNVILTGLNGTWDLGSGALSGATNSSFQAGAGTGILNYSGTITSGTGRAVDIQSKNGGSVNFSGLVTDTDLGINLTNNTGSTINFTGGISASTTTNTAFNATGGGTINATQNNTSIINTLTTTTGRAFNASGVTFGASGVTFRSISANGGTNGIVLTNTSGNFTVTGDGTGFANGSGGTIQNITGSVLGNNPVWLTTVSGTISISSINMSIANNTYSGMHLDNNLGGTTTVNVTGCTFTGVGGAGNVGQNKALLQFEGGNTGVGAANITANVQNSFFFNNRTYGMVATAAGDSLMDVTLNQSGFGTEVNTGAPVNNPGSTITNAPPFSVLVSNGSSAQVDYNITNNTFWGGRGLDGAIYAVTISGATTTATSRLDGFFTGNNIGKAGIVGSGCANGCAGLGLLPGTQGSFNTTISNNDVRQVNSVGINLKNSVTGATGTTIGHFTGNTITEPDTTGAPALQRALIYDIGNSGGSAMSGCLEATSNAMSGGWQAGAFFRITTNNTTGTLVIPGLIPAAGATGVQIDTYIETINPGIGAGNAFTSVGGAINGGAACAATPPAANPGERTSSFNYTYQDSVGRHNELVTELEDLKAPQIATGEAKIGEAVNNETGILQSLSDVANKLVSLVIPTASAQTTEVKGSKSLAPQSGETVTVGPIVRLPAGKGLTITFSVTVDPLDVGEIRTRIVNQGSVTSNETSTVTTDPAASADPACTAPPAIGTATCTPVDRPDTTIDSINRVGSTPTNAASVAWTATFGTQIAGLTASNFTLLNTAGPCSSPSITSVTPVGPSPATAWTIGVSTGTGSCTLGLNMVNSGGLSHDVFLSPIPTALPFVGETIVIDKVAPSTSSFTRFNPATSPTNADTLIFRATFSEDVTSVDAADFSVTGTTATVTLVTPVSGSIYDITVSGGDLAGLNGTVGLNFSGVMDITDIATNALPNTEPAIDQTYLVDNQAPTVNIVDVSPDPRNTAVASIAINFSENVTGFDIADLTLTRDGGANLLPGGASVTGGAQNYTLGATTAVTTPDGAYVLTLAAPGGITDAAGNALVIGDTDSWVKDAAAPTVTINQAAGQSDPTFANPINFTAIFNEPVTDFDDATDVVVTGTAAGVGSATVVITPNSTTNYTVAISGITGDGTVIATIPVGVAIDAATNSNGASTSTDNTVTFVTCAPPPANMLAWYTGDGTPRDIAGGNDGTLTGGTSYAAGKVGQGFSFDGVDDHVAIGDVDLPGTFTIDAWVNPTSLGVERTIVNKDAGLRSYAFTITATGALRAYVQTGAAGGVFTQYQTAAGAVAAGSFQHIAVTYDGAAGANLKFRFYVNGTFVASTVQFSQDNGGTPLNTADPARVGLAFDGSSPFLGVIDELELFTRVLSQPEIQSIVTADGSGKCKPSDLRVAKTAVGTFTQGSAASYTISVSNDGPQPTAGTVSLVDILPAGLTATSLTGTGWTCVLGTLTCTRTDALPSGAVYPDITLGVTVAQNSPLSVINNATASGGGEMDASDSFDNETTTIVGVAQTPSVTGATTVHGAQTTSGLVITPNAGDGTEVTHYKITNILNGTLFQNNGTTPITAGSFITRAEGLAGLKFTPNLSFVGNATFDIQASISGVDGGLGGSVITATIVVNQANSVTTITGDTPDPSVFGGNVVINFTVLPLAPGAGVPAGNVVVTVSGGAETCTGTAAAGTCTLALNAIGARTLTATYVGDTFFVGSSDTETHQVDQAATTTTITTDLPDPSVTGEVVAVSFTVTANAPGAGTPTGNVNVTVSGGAETCTGTVAAGTCNITLNSVGSRTLTATYVGDTNFTSSSDTEAHTVSQAATTTTTVSDLPDASVVGQPVTITYTVVANAPGSGTPTGNVVITVSGGAETCTGTVATGTCNITLTAAGARTLTATYQGDANYLTSSDTEPHQVNQAATSFTVVDDTPDPTNIDQTYTVSWTLAVTAPGAGTPTGTVTVNDGTGDSCTATLPATSCTLNSLTQGTKTLTYTYSGDSNFLGATNNATTHVVNCTPNPIVQNTNDAGAGSLRKAVADVCSTAGQNTITFASPFFDTARTITLTTGEIVLPRTMNIQGTGASLLTISGNNASRIFSLTGAFNVALGGMTLTAGNGVGAADTNNGGAILNNGGNLSITSSVITANTASAGSGALRQGSPAGTTTFINSTVSNNTTGGFGGAIRAVFGTLNIVNSTFSGNSSTTNAATGGAIDSSVTLNVTNSTFSGNSVPNGSSNGGAIMQAGTAVITNSTITNNTTVGANSAGGLLQLSGTVTVRSSIIAGNVNNTTIPDARGAFTSQGYNLVGSCPAACSASGFGGTADQSGTLIAPLNPQIGALANNGGPTFTHALLPTSPAVDKGINAVVPLITDQRGEQRPFDIPSITPASGGDNTDIGSYELNTIPTTLALASSANPSVFGQNVTFTATIATVPPGGTVTGDIDFTIDGNPVAACQNVALVANQATCSTAALSVGAHTIFADFDENLPFLASNATMTQNVDKANTTTAVTAAPASSVFGQAVTFTATVGVVAPGAGTPTGSVTFTIDGTTYCANTPLTGLTATCTQAGLPALPAGARNVVATYNGDGNFNTSSGSLIYTVIKASTTTTIVSDLPDPSLVNQPYTVTWAVAVTAPGAGTPTGTVTVNGGTGGGTCTAAVAAGSCQLTPTTTGVKTISATYNGDANFNTSTSATTTHTVNVGITGTVRNGLTLAPITGVSITLYQLPAGTPITTATTNAAGLYTFSGIFTGPLATQPTVIGPPYYDPVFRNIPSVATNVSGQDFLQYTNIGDIPRTLNMVTQYVVPGQAGSMPFILNSQDNEVSVAFSISYDINPFAQPPTFVCGAQAPGCTITQDTSVLGRVGVTIVPAGGGFSRVTGEDGTEAPGLKEIARMNFQTLVTPILPSTPITFQASPTDAVILDNGGNPLLTVFGSRNVVFVRGNEGDVAGRNAGSGTFDAADVVQTRRFVAGLDAAFVNTFNEFQRADTAPGPTKGNGELDATDVIQTRRYVAGLDAPQLAGGAGFPNPGPIAPPTGENPSEIIIGTASATNNTRISVPVGLKTSGRELAASFAIKYDEERFGDPTVELASGAPEGVTLTLNTSEPGVIRIVVDSARAFGIKDGDTLLEITFGVKGDAPSGEGMIEVEDLVFSDAEARATRSKATTGTISIAGPNPAAEDKGARSRDRERRNMQKRPDTDLVEIWLNKSSVVLKRSID